MATLGVNIDHVATLRAQRGTPYPSPVDAAVLAQMAGAHQITVHLREDRRHIVDNDVTLLKQILQIPLNLEMANTPEMVKIALDVKPAMVTLVPEKREEKTTEGGLAVDLYFEPLAKTVSTLQAHGIPVSLFIEPKLKDIEMAAEMKAKMIEIHTGKYAELSDTHPQECHLEFEKIAQATQFAHEKGLIVHAGHGLHYRNARRIAQIPHMQDLNIGHSIVSHAVLVGLERAIREMHHVVC